MNASSTATDTRLCRVLSRLYGAALKLLPSGLRDYRNEMDEVFRHRVREERRARGRRGAVLFFASSLFDIPAASRSSRAPEPELTVVNDSHRFNPTLPARGGNMERLFQTFKLAGRSLRRRPGYAATVAVTLALGIAATTTVFSLVNAVNFGAFPYPDAERIVVLSETAIERGNAPVTVSYRNYESWKAGAESFDTVVAQRYMAMPLLGDEESRLVLVNMVTAGYLELMGARAAQGRLLDASDIDEGRNVAVVSEALWNEQLLGAADVIGRPLRVGTRTYTIAGVMSAEFHDLASPTATDVWLPAPAITETLPVALENRRQRAFQVLARLNGEASLAAAGSEMNGIAAALRAEFPDANEGYGISVQSLRTSLGGDLPDRLFMLLSGAAGLLLVACINVAGIVMVRGSERGREIALHRALGASGLESASGLIAEALLLAMLGGLGGVALAYGALRAVLASEALSLPDYVAVAIDMPVLGFALATALIVGLVAGVVPAAKVARADLRESLVGGGGRGSVGGAGGRGRMLLVVAEIAAAVLLVVGAGLLLRSVSALRGTDLGFRADDVIVAQVELPRPDFEITEVALFSERLRAELEAVPGIEFAGTWGPNYPFNPTVLETVLREGDVATDNAPRVIARYHAVSSGALRAMNIPLVVGRDIDETDRNGAVQSVVISESLAAELWPGEDPIGRRIGTSAADGSGREWSTVVGVAQDVRLGGRQAGPGGLVTNNEIYYSIAQRNHRRRGELVLMIGHSPGMVGIGDTIRDVVARLAPQLPVHNMQTMAQIVGAEERMPDFTASLMMVFGGLALFMAALGIYGVLAQSAAQRRGEIGLRKALGASNGSIVQLMVTAGVKMTVLGIGIGLVLTLWANRLLIDFLYDTDAGDPGVIALACGLLFVVALAAALIPTLRALRVSPTTVLRDTS